MLLSAAPYSTFYSGSHQPVWLHDELHPEDLAGTPYHTSTNIRFNDIHAYLPICEIYKSYPAQQLHPQLYS
jgi:hypothetical protein